MVLAVEHCSVASVNGRGDERRMRMIGYGLHLSQISLGKKNKQQPEQPQRMKFGERNLAGVNCVEDLILTCQLDELTL